MNREIIYRGKRCSDGEWVYGFYVESKYSWQGHKPHKSWIVPNAISNGGFFNVLGRYAVKDDTVGQFTGLVDKNGVKIFEGDIVTMMRKPEKRRHYELVRHVVTCHNVCDWVFESLSNDVLGLMIANHSDFDSYKFEVIGNIYDNQDLLNKK